jgi:hypothetical protein
MLYEITNISAIYHGIKKENVFTLLGGLLHLYTLAKKENL